MNSARIQNEDVPFSHPIKVGQVSGSPLRLRLEADEAARKGLARLWNVDSVSLLSAELMIGRWKRDGIRIKGHVTGELQQACVVTLDPVFTKIDEEIDQIFVPEGSKLARIVADEAAETMLDPEGPDQPETFAGDTIDAGELVAEFAALAIDPYPKKEGVAFSDHIEGSPDDLRRPNPFAVLKDWKKD
ncbi:MAG: YceD family protein [Allorhizobium sp.]